MNEVEYYRREEMAELGRELNRIEQAVHDVGGTHIRLTDWVDEDTLRVEVDGCGVAVPIVWTPDGMDMDLDKTVEAVLGAQPLRFAVQWDNGRDASGVFPQRFKTEQEAERFAEDWVTEMTALIDEPTEDDEGYSAEVIEVEA